MLYVDVHPDERVEMCIKGVSLNAVILLAGCTTSTYNIKNTPKLTVFKSKNLSFLTVYNPIFYNNSEILRHPL
jgi:uncharacterized lipoprotein YajG